MIGHQNLGALGNEQLGVEPRLFDIVQLFAELLNVERNTVADDAGGVVIADAAGHQMKRKPAAVVDNGVARVCTALKPDNDIRFFCKHVRNFAFALVAPVGADDRLYRYGILPKFALLFLKQSRNHNTIYYIIPRASCQREGFTNRAVFRRFFVKIILKKLPKPKKVFSL